MALPMLVGGSECGPSNALKDLSRRFEQDRGVQQDFFNQARAGSSREAFRSQPAGGSATADQDAARFFSAANGPGGALGQLAPDGHFDVSALRQALPMHAHGPPALQQQAELPGAAATADWGMDFMQQAMGGTPMTQTYQPAQTSQAHAAHVHAPSINIQQGPTWNPGMSAFRMNTMQMQPGFMPQMQMQPQATAATTSKRISWDKEFSALELNVGPTSEHVPEVVQEQPQQEQSAPAQKQFDGDELARTAGMLLDHVQHETNPKFKKSQFLELMKQLRDGEVIVEGNQMVESDGTRTSASANVDVKGKGRAVDPVLGPLNTSAPRAFGLDGGSMAMHQQVNEPQTVHQDEGDVREEDPNDAYFRQENADYAKYWNDQQSARWGAKDTPETAMWDRLQEDWDKFEATTTGVKPVSTYQFQEQNPYLLGESSKSRHHLLHGGGRQAFLESVLELEAAVQRDMNNASIWYELGVKQQENEREHKALQALERAVELDPTHLPSWLALGISYTNDSNRTGTYEAISKWVEMNTKYADAVARFNAENPPRADMRLRDQFTRLIDCLIAMARSDLGSEVDADIQIALAVLLNTNEEYEKAQDCFRTALAVRPEDWLLYNRVGATMANSGKPEEALQYYYKALELNPTYIRARFNLGIACINLRRYEEAAQHVLDALLLQESDATMDSAGDKQDVISNALWDSLKTSCLHMQRADLATLCDLRDLDGFRKRFYG